MASRVTTSNTMALYDLSLGLWDASLVLGVQRSFCPFLAQ
jgi:hypothetical protein